MIIIISCLQWRSSTVRLDPPFLQFRLCLVSPRSVGSLSWCVRHHMWPRRTHRFRSLGSPTDASLPGWQPVLSAFDWPSAMHATAASDHSGVVPSGGRNTSSDCSGWLPTVPATAWHELLRAYTGQAGRLRRNCCAIVGGSSRAGGDGGCVAGRSVVWCARVGWVRCMIIIVLLMCIGITWSSLKIIN